MRSNTFLQIATFLGLVCVFIKPNYAFQDNSDYDQMEENDSGQLDRVKRSFIPYRTGKKVASQVSNALDHLLFFSGYDKRIRPQVSL